MKKYGAKVLKSRRMAKINNITEPNPEPARDMSAVIMAVIIYSLMSGLL